MRKTIFKKLEAQGLIANYNRLRKNLPPKLPERVFVWDETLREGVQTPTVFLTYVERVKLAKLLDEAGVSVINVGFPALSEEEKNSVKRIANEGFQQASIAASAHASRSEIEACLDCGVKEILISTPFNGLNLQYRLKTSKEHVLKNAVECIEYAKKHGVTVDFVLEDASRTPLPEILQIFEAAIKAGADRLVIADTVGFLRPLSMRYLIAHIRDGLQQSLKKEPPLSVHCHNDFGLATANTLAAVEEGVAHLHTCIAGFGERAGVAPLEEVVSALEILYNIDTGVDMKKLYRLAQQAEKSFALPIQFHKPIVGENVFAYEVDEHVEGMLAHPLIYVPFPPEMIEREAQFYISRSGGRQLVQKRLEAAGIKAMPWQIDEIVRRIRSVQESLDKGGTQMTFYQIKKLMKELRKGLTEEEFWQIVEQVTRQKPKIPSTLEVKEP
ncbi:MAG: 2-isopropylmalate synthase [Candidatus Bathyarchaeota archaeon]|nr:2-isopropylmalate synthase [Candidatus Bathyarchaeota archaeon]MDW8040641.1 2-isopropylmalate synthase [Nitrososphaerota archaeon]